MTLARITQGPNFSSEIIPSAQSNSMALTSKSLITLKFLAWWRQPVSRARKVFFTGVMMTPINIRFWPSMRLWAVRSEPSNRVLYRILLLWSNTKDDSPSLLNIHNTAHKKASLKTCWLEIQVWSYMKVKKIIGEWIRKSRWDLIIN